VSFGLEYQIIFLLVSTLEIDLLDSYYFRAGNQRVGNALFLVISHGYLEWPVFLPEILHQSYRLPFILEIFLRLVALLFMIVKSAQEVFERIDQVFFELEFVVVHFLR
jgi:hypothetical protein